MTYRTKQLRSGATAIAFALALSSTPLLAQTGTQPVVNLPTPAPPAAAPAPAPTLPTPAAPTVRAATPAPAPVVVPEARAETRAAPAQRTRASTTTRSTQATRSAAPAAAPVIAQAEPAAPAPAVPLAETPVIEAAPVMAEAAPAAVEPVVAEEGSALLPIAGGAAGLLVLAGGAYALSRRRRTGDEDYATETWEQDHVAYAEPVAPAEPVWREPAPAAAPAPTMAAAALPAGMDLSRYGRHVQAAYAGPTPDNPSLSLKRRLKRAAFFDQRERMAREAGEPSDMVQPVATPQAAKAPAPQRDQLVTSRRISPKAGTEALFGFRPTFQN